MNNPNMENQRQSRYALTIPLYGLILGGLCVFAHSHPLGAIPAGGVAAAILVTMGGKVSVKASYVMGFLVIFGLVLWSERAWSSLALVASIAAGLTWLLLPYYKMDSDDRIYLPSLLFVFWFVLLYYTGFPVLGFKGGFHDFIGLTGATDKLNEIIREGAEQISGESREEYLKMTRDFMSQFPYYYMGIQLAVFPLVLNFILRILRNREVLAGHFLLFKIKERYVFLLIFGMGIEIFRYFLDRKELLDFSRSIFVFLGVTYFLAGLAVIGFLILMQRLRSGSTLSRAFTFILVFIIIMKPIICSTIGLLDIWFDFRKLKTIPGGGLNS